MSLPLIIKADVKKALASGQAVVALESTIISHGLPYPENLATARDIEQKVRDEGAIPATIAILDGEVHIGLDDAQLDILANGQNPVTKVSRRDIASVIAAKAHGATTVAATMIFAEMAGIAVFATGGIGGVHRGAEIDFDISADLPELARTNLCVVSAGPKAILDLQLTMEYLETAGVPVIGYRTDDLPAFWSAHSGIMLADRADSPERIASIMNIKWQAGLSGGLMIANPVPEADEIPADDLAKVIEDALQAAKDNGISGKAVTPFLLSFIKENTQGASLVTNQALVFNNAKLAAQSHNGNACAYAKT